MRSALHKFYATLILIASLGNRTNGLPWGLIDFIVDHQIFIGKKKVQGRFGWR